MNFSTASMVFEWVRGFKFEVLRSTDFKVNTCSVVWRQHRARYPRRREPIPGGLAAASLPQTLGYRALCRHPIKLVSLGGLVDTQVKYIREAGFDLCGPIETGNNEALGKGEKVDKQSIGDRDVAAEPPGMGARRLCVQPSLPELATRASRRLAQ